MRVSQRFWVTSDISFSRHALVTTCYLSLIPLCSFHETDEVKDSERERLSTRRRRQWRRKSEMDKNREQYLEHTAKTREIEKFQLMCERERICGKRGAREGRRRSCKVH